MAINSVFKTAIVTGASGGIGIAIVKKFLNDGYAVIGIDRDQTCEIESNHYTHQICDVRDYEKLRVIIENSKLHGSCTLINCVGIREICSISDLSIEKWEEVISTNVSSVFVSSKTFAEKLKKTANPNGCIINIASVSGLMGEPERTAYVTSKHAVIGLTKQLAIEYGKFGIRANAVAPGVIRTPLTEEYYHNAEQVKKIRSGQFVDYFATPDDIAPLVLFLASQKSNFITGATFVADGGWTAGKII